MTILGEHEGMGTYIVEFRHPAEVFTCLQFTIC